MKQTGLLARLSDETGLVITANSDPSLLAGFFNRFRPDGQGLSRVFANDPIEHQIWSRIEKMFRATAPGAHLDETYFVVRTPAPASNDEIARAAAEYLDQLRCIGDCLHDHDLLEVIRGRVVSLSAAGDTQEDGDAATVVYEAITDLLARLQPDTAEVFALKEALYSMAADYFLVAYALWPAIKAELAIRCDFDAYFELWRHRVRVEFTTDKRLAVSAA